MKNKKGFTLIELLIVLAIIAILTPIVIPKVKTVKEDAINKKVNANIFMVKTFLEDRRFLDKSTIYDEYDKKTTEEKTESLLSSVLDIVKTNVGQAMEGIFTASRAIENPFTGSKTISYNTESLILNNVDCSIVIVKDTRNAPENEELISYPENTELKRLSGKVAVIIFKDRYVGYGIDKAGNVVSPFIVKMPPEKALTLNPPIQTNPEEPSPSSGTTPNDILNDMINIPFNVIGNFDKNTNINLNPPPSSPPDRAFIKTGGTLNIIGDAYIQGKYIRSATKVDITGNLKMLGNFIDITSDLIVGENADFLGKQKVLFSGYTANVKRYSYIQTDGEFNFQNGQYNSNTNRDMYVAADPAKVVTPWGAKINYVEPRTNYEGKVLLSVDTTKSIPYNNSDRVYSYGTQGDKFIYNPDSDVAFCRLTPTNSSNVTFDILDEAMSINKAKLNGNGSMNGTVKVLFIDGDFTLRHRYNNPISTGNWFIYCTGNLYLPSQGAIELKNSAVYCRSAVIENTFTVDMMGSRLTQGNNDYINVLKDYFNYYLKP